MIDTSRKNKKCYTFALETFQFSTSAREFGFNLILVQFGLVFTCQQNQSSTDTVIHSSSRRDQGTSFFRMFSAKCLIYIYVYLQDKFNMIFRSQKQTKVISCHPSGTNPELRSALLIWQSLLRQSDHLSIIFISGPEIQYFHCTPLQQGSRFGSELNQ